MNAKTIIIGISGALLAIACTWGFGEITGLKKRLIHKEQIIGAHKFMLDGRDSIELNNQCISKVSTIKSAVRECGPPKAIYFYHKYATYESNMMPCDDGIAMDYSRHRLIFSCSDSFIEAQAHPMGQTWTKTYDQ